MQDQPHTLRSGENRSGHSWDGVQTKTLINYGRAYPTITTQDQENTLPFSTAWGCQCWKAFILSGENIFPKRLNYLENAGVTEEGLTVRIWFPSFPLLRCFPQYWHRFLMSSLSGCQDDSQHLCPGSIQ